MAGTIVVQNKFTGGLKTDFTGLSFPGDSCTDVDNMTFDIISNITRREGFDFETNYTTNTVDRTDRAINTFIWTNVGGDGNTKILVSQIGGTLYFYRLTNATTATPLSTTKLAATITLSSFQVSGATSPNGIECQFTDGNGYLFVFHPSLDPFYCTYNSGTITGTAINIQIRDVIGIQESVADNYRPLTLSADHTYNLYNQGWTNAPAWSATSTSTVTYQTGSRTFTVQSGLSIAPGDQAIVTLNAPAPFNVSMSGTVTSYSGTTLTINITSVSSPGSGPTFSTWVITKLNAGLVTAWHTAIGNYPSNADVWWNFKNASNVFDPATTYANTTLASSPAAKGSFILSAFNQTRSSNSGVAGITDVTTTTRPRTGTWFQGRVWYAGVDASFAATGDAVYTTWTENLYFSQVIEKPSQFGYCYDVNDPTSETLFDLLPTDGGVVTIQGSGSIFKLFPIQNGLLVFAANGIWFITGSQGIGFQANDYTITKISSIQSISSTSFVDVQGFPVFWNEEGIYMVAPGQQGGLSVNSLTVGNVGAFYEEIPKSAKLHVRGSYHPINYVIQWIYKSAEETTVTSRYEFDKVLNFNTVLKSFFPWTIVGTPKVNGINYVVGPGGSGTPDPGFKYLCSYVNAGSYKFTFAQEQDTNYVDWASFDTGTNYTSDFITGYMIPGKASMLSQLPYLTIYGLAGNDTQAQVQSCWDYTTTGNSGRWSTKQRLQFGTDTDRTFVIKKIRTRGQGRVVQLKFSSVAGKPMSLIGWSLWINSNEVP